MIYAERIKSKIVDVWSQDDAQTVKFCHALIDYIANEPNQKTEILTYGSIAQVLEITPDNPTLSRVVAILSSNFDALTLGFSFFDESETYYLEDEEIKLWIRNRILYHPNTGELVEQAGENIYPYFIGNKSALISKVENR
ncbi:hypothetical protein [Parasphingorhabdus sp.]|uniref:hypothetical protein n=1 Tax=Parasphingorhabdus sp. TaxID=2709688 RepID=UPI003D2B0BDF